MTRPTVTMPLLPDDADITQRTRDFLNNLNLLPGDDELDAAGSWSAAFSGPSQGVALIEAGGTALAKWWATGLGAGIAGVWAYVRAFWDENEALHDEMIWGASIVSAALVVSIAALLSFDLRGRAAAMVATVNARAQIGTTMLNAARRAGGAPATDLDGAHHVVALPGLPARNLVGRDSVGWMAIAMLEAHGDGGTRFLLVKGDAKQWVPWSDVEFD